MDRYPPVNRRKYRTRAAYWTKKRVKGYSRVTTTETYNFILRKWYLVWVWRYNNRVRCYGFSRTVISENWQSDGPVEYWYSYYYATTAMVFTNALSVAKIRDFSPKSFRACPFIGRGVRVREGERDVTITLAPSNCFESRSSRHTTLATAKPRKNRNIINESRRTRSRLRAKQEPPLVICALYYLTLWCYIATEEIKDSTYEKEKS